MGSQQEFKKVKLFCGLIYGSHDVYMDIVGKLQLEFSKVDFESQQFDFDFTTYYNEEMGSPLYRRFISFDRLITPDRLPDIKLITNRLETANAVDGKRVVNLDPGYLSDANVIIATTKNHYHRVPLAHGIYAHMEYVLKKKKPVPLEWTYPDFRSPQYMAFFEQLLPIYRLNLKDEQDLKD